MAVAASKPSNNVTAFRIPGDRIIKLHVGTRHVGPHFIHDECLFLNLENEDTNSRIGGGVTAGIDFGLSVIAEIAGETAARRVQLGIEYDPAPPFDSGNPDKASTIKSELLSARYNEFRALYRTRIEQAGPF